MELCTECREPRARGLCYPCSFAVLPQLARPAWLRLIGDVLIEQVKRQLAIDAKTDAKTGKHERALIEKARRKADRKRSRAQRFAQLAMVGRVAA